MTFAAKHEKVVANDTKSATTWRRVQDSNPRGHHCPNGFQDRPVMTASVTLRIYSVVLKL